MNQITKEYTEVIQSLRMSLWSKESTIRNLIECADKMEQHLNSFELSGSYFDKVAKITQKYRELKNRIG